MLITEDDETEKKTEFASQPPGNKMAYAEAMKKQLSNKAKIERMVNLKQISEIKKTEKLQQMKNVSTIQIAKLLNGKKESEIRGRDR